MGRAHHGNAGFGAFIESRGQHGLHEAFSKHPLRAVGGCCDNTRVEPAIRTTAAARRVGFKPCQDAGRQTGVWTCFVARSKVADHAGFHIPAHLDALQKPLTLLFALATSFIDDLRGTADAALFVEDLAVVANANRAVRGFRRTIGVAFKAGISRVRSSKRFRLPFFVTGLC